MSDLQTQFDNLISEHQRIRAEFQKSAQELFKNIPATEANKSYEVMVSVRELPPQPIRLQSATAPLKGQ